MRIRAIQLLLLVAVTSTPTTAAQVLLVTSGGSNQVLAYDATSGAFLKIFASGGGLDSPSGMAFGLDGNLYVSSTGTDEVLRFDRNTGAFLNTFIRGIRRPSALALGPDGNLYVGSFGSEAIYKCHGRTGEVLASFGHSTGTLAFDINGNLFASNTSSNTVDSYSIQTGSLIRTLGFNTGLNAPAGIVFANPILFVASNGSNSILRFSAEGQAMPPIPSGPELSHPLALAFSSDGILHVSTSGNEVLRYEFGGRFLGRLVAPGSGGLQYPAAMVLHPDQASINGPPDTMRIVRGDGQESIVRNLFPEPLTVEVLSANRPLGGQTVRFEVASGLVGLTSSQSVTDATGQASTFAFAMDSFGPATVRATAGTVSVLFRLTVTQAPPQISPGGVLHAARRTPMGLKDSTIPLGGMMVIQGKGLGPVTGINGSVPYRLRLPDDARGTSVHLVSLADNSLVSEAPVVFASDTKVIAIVPSGAPLGATSVVVSYDGRQSRPVATTLASSNFGIFTRNELGHGPAVAFIVDESGMMRPIGLSNPARAGQMVALRGTGLGPISTEDNAPSNTPFDVSDVDVIIGNLQVRALSAGRVLDAPAMDEIQFRIPDDASLPDGCYVPVAIRTGSRLSNFATIAKAAAGSNGGCAHPMKLSLSSLTRLDAAESVNAGVFGIYRLLLQTPLGTGVLSGEGAIFSRFDSNSLFIPGGLTTMTVTEGACTVYQAPALTGVSSLVPVPIAPGLDAGPTLTLSPPTVRSASLPRRSSGGYDRSSFSDGALLPKELQGEWKLAGAGGSDIKAFSAMQELPPPIVWSNKDEIIEVDREKDLMVTWQTDGEARFERVLVSGGMIRFSELYPDGVFLQFACSAPFYSGALTVPSLILQQLPASSNDDFVTFFTVANSAFDGRSSAFPASSSDGRPLDATAATYVIGEGKAVTFR